MHVAILRKEHGHWNVRLEVGDLSKPLVVIEHSGDHFQLLRRRRSQRSQAKQKADSEEGGVPARAYQTPRPLSSAFAAAVRARLLSTPPSALPSSSRDRLARRVDSCDQHAVPAWKRQQVEDALKREWTASGRSDEIYTSWAGRGPGHTLRGASFSSTSASAGVKETDPQPKGKFRIPRKRPCSSGDDDAHASGDVDVHASDDGASTLGALASNLKRGRASAPKRLPNPPIPDELTELLASHDRKSAEDAETRRTVGREMAVKMDIGMRVNPTLAAAHGVQGRGASGHGGDAQRKRGRPSAEREEDAPYRHQSSTYNNYSCSFDASALLRDIMANRAASAGFNLLAPPPFEEGEMGYGKHDLSAPLDRFASIRAKFGEPNLTRREFESHLDALNNARDDLRRELLRRRNKDEVAGMGETGSLGENMSALIFDIVRICSRIAPTP